MGTICNRTSAGPIDLGTQEEPMSYTLPADVDDRPIAIDGAGTLGRRIASVYAAGGTDIRMFDLSQ
jgi:lactate dehydrogenase-like 2-hydroxyacid dehydrogenase